MPSGMHQVEVGVPINKVWNFIKDMDNWAPLIPGYIHHQKFTKRQSTWEFYSDIGILKKKVSLMINIKEWNEPTKVSFTLQGVNEKFSGGGYYLAEAIDKNKTRMTGFLDMTAEGPMGFMINGVLNSYIPKITEEMVIAISTKLEELNRF
ncbi:CoxG family protein [Neobacillus sp. NPDC097160]|uniref:CoxG family protein n=1 Tax=Neobacillus sp. NPDC097160 TaxID=3364298 RepID=UPI003816461D